MKSNNRKDKPDEANRVYKKGNRRKGKNYNRGAKPNEAVATGSAQNGALSSLNDISWYARFPELLDAAAKFPFPYRPGMQLRIDGLANAGASPLRKDLRLPGVLSLSFIPCISTSVDARSPASIVAKEMWARIRGKFSGSLDEDPPDLFMYAMAVDSMHAVAAAMKRVYRLLDNYPTQNRNYPDDVLHALGVANPDYWREHRMDLYGMINTYIHQANKFSMPNNMDIFTRHRWMNENVYLDEPTPNAQSYVFHMTDAWIVFAGGSKGTELTKIGLDAMWTDINAWKTVTGAIINALSNWDDAYTINGHIERAYEGETFYTSDLVGAEEVLMPVYQAEVLSQIENTTTVGFPNGNIEQDPTTNNIIWNPVVSGTSVQPMINLHMDNPTAADVTIASRLHAGCHSGELICGTEVVTEFKYFSTGSGYNQWQWTTDYSLNMVGPTLGYTLVWATIMGWFAHHPRLYWTIPNKVVADGYAHTEDANVLWSMGNVTAVDWDLMKELHRVCAYSEFNCFR